MAGGSWCPWGHLLGNDAPGHVLCPQLGGLWPLLCSDRRPWKAGERPRALGRGVGPRRDPERCAGFSGPSPRPSPDEVQLLLLVKAGSTGTFLSAGGTGLLRVFLRQGWVTHPLSRHRQSRALAEQGQVWGLGTGASSPRQWGPGVLVSSLRPFPETGAPHSWSWKQDNTPGTRIPGGGTWSVPCPPRAFRGPSHARTTVWIFL